VQPVLQRPLPEDALLATYRGGQDPESWDGAGDCFAVPIDRTVALAEFVVAFYTAPVFRVERWILRVVAGAPSTDQEARDLVAGSRDSFAVWRIAERTDTQLLMCDRYGKTRSWFRVTPQDSAATLLQFGSAVAARRRTTGSVGMGGGFRLLLGFHRFYSKLLLRSAWKQLHSAARGRFERDDY
jgi:hypothetical protein